jgi:exonuclease SbcC
MKPEILTLRNIGPFRGSHTVDFTALGDIFLVYGKTGAGKTTLFDALSFAFYGKVPGSRNGIERQMRSQFADDDATASVELVFTTGGKRWRIARTLAYEKIGVRSGKPVLVQEESTLDEEVSGSWESRTCTNKSDTDRKILDIIKLSAEEFSRIVLLPQGEFARFLKLNSNERKDVLAKLFPVEQYSRVTELARTRAKEASLRVAETEKEILALGKEFNALSWDTDRGKIESDIAALRNAQTAARAELESKSAILEKSRAAGENLKRKAELEKTVAELESRAVAQAEKERHLAEAHSAAPLLAELRALETDRERLEALKRELARTDSEKKAETDALSALQGEEPAMRNAVKEKESLLPRKERLETAVTIAGTLDELEARFEATKKGLVLEKKTLTVMDAENKARAARIAELAADIGAVDARSKRQTEARDELEKAKRLKDLATEYARETASLRAHREALERINGAIAQNRKDAAIAKEECAGLEAELETEKTASLASVLAERLENGKPCPVCGATQHPAPAKRAESAFTAAERLAAGKRRSDALEADHTRLCQERSAREANLATAEERLALLEANGSLPSPVPSPEDAVKALEQAVALANKATDDLGASRTAIREAESIRAKEAEANETAARVRARVSELETKAAEERTGIANAKERYLEAFRDKGSLQVNEPETGDSGTPISPADAADELERCESRILELEAAVTSWETRVAETKNRASSLDGKSNELARSIASLETETEKNGAAFAARCAAAGFTGEEAVTAAALAEGEVRALEADIENFRRELSSAKAQLERVSADVARWDGPEPEAVEAEIARIRETLDESGAELERGAAALAGLDDKKTRWDALEAERASRSLEASRIKALSDDLTGNNPAKTSFDAWILGMYLEEITAYANTRLERMSEGRYRIKLNESYRKGNSLAGLELEILDAHTGKTRPSGTLSGGETFMASISLALGLADSIQSRAGGIQLDAVFIDEGFGSLDESSLERAITILDEIRGSRMVGLISHVGELRSRIPNRIEIIKTGAGSEIRADTV